MFNTSSFVSTVRRLCNPKRTQVCSCQDTIDPLTPVTLLQSGSLLLLLYF